MAANIAQYLRQSVEELKKVTWPTRRQTLNDAGLVVGISLAVAAFLGAVDYVLTELLKIVI